MRGVTNGLVILLGLAMSAGCNQTSGDGTGTDLGMPDAGTDVDMGGGGGDAGDVDASTCMNTIPTSGFGAHVTTKFSPLTLNDCMGVPHDFYDQTYCTSTLTVFTIAAGWCHPCNLEADQLESMIITPYASRGVRVIQVLTQDDSYGLPTTPGFCDSWMTRHHLSYTDHVTLLDPDGLTQIYDPAQSIPATLIVDGDGVIQFLFNGTSTDPTSGTAALTDTTACLDKLLMSPRQLCH